MLARGLSIPLVLLALITTTWTPWIHAALELPPAPKNYVYDPTNVISGPEKEALTQILAQEDQRAGNQVLVAVFPSLEGEDQVDYVNRLFKHWNPGQKDKNNGVIFAIFLNDRVIRIEVGYGLEPYLTDALSKRIIELTVVPAFKSGQISEGLLRGSQQILQVIQGNTEAVPQRRTKRARPAAWTSLFALIFIIFMISKFERYISIGAGGLRPGYRRRGGGSPWISTGGSSGGFGGFGGGGFGGGGGMSGGGGASGRW